jgi:2,3,4,5-tetrahydropyridine-2-carboxylate N-succinyltransferase
MTQQLQSLIEQAWEDRANLSPKAAPADVRDAVANVIGQLDQGALRVAEKKDGEWTVNQWIKKAVLLSFRLEDNTPMPAGGFTQFYDKVPSKFASYTAEDFAKGGFRVVPPAVARRGSFIAKNAVLMPSYVNIGAYVDEGTMVDTWATVGSCAQIGKNVHLSGGVGIGGVLEPLQANPVIIEDNCFIGARSEVVEGVIVEENSVISMGVYQLRPHPGGLGGGGGQPALEGRHAQPVLRRDRQEGRRQDARQGWPQRAAARRLSRNGGRVV